MWRMGGLDEGAGKREWTAMWDDGMGLDGGAG